MTKHERRQNLGASLDFAWRVHSAQESWTAKVDVKASIFLAAQVGLLVVLATIMSAGGLSHLLCAETVIVCLGVCFLLAGAGITGSVVYPQLSTTDGTEMDLIYFGHLKGRTESEVQRALEKMSLENQLEAVSGQLVRMSKTNWDKHRRLQISIWLTGAGTTLALLGVASCLIFK